MASHTFAGMALTRRALLLDSAALLALGGCAEGSNPNEPPGERPRGGQCRPAPELTQVTKIGGARLIYEQTRGGETFRIDPAFARRLAAWLADFRAAFATNVDQLWTYGTWVDGEPSGCHSFHNSGRAFDLTRVVRRGQALASCRYDQWRNRADPARALTAYWRLAASLHLHFAYVLTYLYDAGHHDHIHVDNGLSGSRMSRYLPSSGAQTQALQAICTHLWQREVRITGRLDAATRTVSAAVLDSLGTSARLPDQKAWQVFLRASMRR